MTLSRRSMLTAATAAMTLPALPRSSRAQAAAIKIGVLNDLSGPYANTGGITSVICAKQAVEEYANAQGLNVEVISADHQNKPDLAVSIVRRVVRPRRRGHAAGRATSSVALAVQYGGVREKNKVYLNSGASSALTGEQCSPNFIRGPTIRSCWRSRPAGRW